MACFDGSDAAGLPCEQDLDCGLKLRCEDGYCGGRQSGTTEGSTTDPTTSMDSTTSDPNNECGNGVVDEPDETCEPMTPHQNDALCDRDCSMPQCGDGIENPLAAAIEVCDASENDGPVDGEDCDIDCSPVVCGDNHHNVVAEPCDDGNADDFDGCTVQCFAPFFSDPMTSPTESWSVEAPTYTAEVPDSDPIEYTLPEESSPDFPDSSEPTGWRHVGNRWASGARPTIGLPTNNHGAAGATNLVSAEIVLSLDLDGDGSIEDDAAIAARARYELRFHHEYAFDSCGNAPGDGDGGVVRIRDVETDEETIVAPIGGYQQVVADGQDCLVTQNPPRPPNPLVLESPPTPYGGVPAFSGGTQVTEDVRVDLDAFRGRTIRVIFQQGFDCLSCAPVKDDAWAIDHVIVAPFLD